jgi:alanine racemase
LNIFSENPEASACLTIDLDALIANWRFLKNKAGKAQCGAVVKANAYGTGLEQAVQALDKAGCKTFFVAHLSEGVRARDVCGGADIYVLNGLTPGTAAIHTGLKLRPVLGTREEIEEWSAFCQAEPGAPPAALHIDTGMNRLGLRLEEALHLKNSSLTSSLKLSLLMSHFVSAEEPQSSLNAYQIEMFDHARELFPRVPASIANSSGIFLKHKPFFDLVRPGYALYGGNPTPSEPNPMRPVVQLQSRIIQIRTVPDGETVGYNGQWTAQGARRIAVLSTGYADGFPRAASSTDVKRIARMPIAEVIINDEKCPFAGRVSMDLITVDITHLPEGSVKRGDPALLIGDGLGIDQVAQNCGTIGYEILTGLGARYQRIYTQKPKSIAN